MAWQSLALAQSRRRELLGVMVLFLLSSAASLHAGLPQRLRNVLAQVPHSRTSVSACVVDLASGETVFSLNENNPLIPASTMKIFAMAIAIEELGSGFAFETILGTDGIDLFVFGDGDPAIGDEKLTSRRGASVYTVFERWAAILRESGTSNIPGNLIIDESIFDGEFLHPSWEAGDLGKWYAAPVGALNFNDNCVDITLVPQVRGTPPLVEVTPVAPAIRVINKAKSGGSGNPVLHHVFDSHTYRVSGNCPKRWPFGPVSFPDPGLLFADTLRSIFTRQGVTFSGTTQRQRVRQDDGSVPQHIVPLATRRTPLNDVLNRCGKDSQNVFAEALLKRAGYAWSRRTGQTAPVGTWPSGALAVTAMMPRVGTNLDGFHLADGSGLSRDNRCTARQQVATLAWINNQRWSTQFRENLSIGGIDGKLRKRLKRYPNRVFAKTGTMRGICVLTGYIMDAARPRFAFSIMFNGYTGPSTPYRKIQDEFCAALVRKVDGR